jgi:hypothetical protein
MPGRSFDSDALLRAGRNRTVQALIGVGFVVYLAYYLTRFRLSQIWPLVPVGDAAIVFDAARHVFASAAYPAGVFPYSPSAVVLFRTLGAAGSATFMLAWYVLMAAGLIVSVRAALTQERGDVRVAWPLIGAIAILVAGSPIRWDLRNANSNLIYLGLVMAGYGLAGKRPLLSGVLIGLSVSLKLYSGLLMAWLLVNGPRRALYAGVAAMAVLWIALPVALFGFDGMFRLYAGWLAQVARIGDPSFHAQLAVQQPHVPITTLHKAIANLTGEGFHSSRVYALLWLLRAVWIGVLLWYAWRCRHHLIAVAPSRAALADWTVLLLAPLPLSPWLEPYHAIPLLVGAVLCTAIVLDSDTRHRDRWAACAAIVALSLATALRVPFQIRGLGMLAQFLVLTVVLGVLRPRLARAPQPDRPAVRAS